MEKDEPTRSVAVRSEALPLEVMRPKMGALGRVARGAGAVVGVGVTVFAGLGIFGAILDRSHDTLAVSIAGCTFLAGLGIAGASLARAMIRALRAASSPTLTAAEAGPALALAIRQRLLRIASHHGGRLTVAELAAALATAPEPAERALEGALQSGEARLLFSPDGIPVYEFPGLLAAKADAKEPWEH